MHILHISHIYHMHNIHLLEYAEYVDCRNMQNMLSMQSMYNVFHCIFFMQQHILQIFHIIYIYIVARDAQNRALLDTLCLNKSNTTQVAFVFTPISWLDIQILQHPLQPEDMVCILQPGISNGTLVLQSSSPFLNWYKDWQVVGNTWICQCLCAGGVQSHWRSGHILQILYILYILHILSVVHNSVWLLHSLVGCVAVHHCIWAQWTITILVCHSSVLHTGAAASYSSRQCWVQLGRYSTRCKENQQTFHWFPGVFL